MSVHAHSRTPYGRNTPLKMGMLSILQRIGRYISMYCIRKWCNRKSLGKTCSTVVQQGTGLSPLMYQKYGVRSYEQKFVASPLKGAV